MSSAMMTRTFGFCGCCAIAVAPIIAIAVRASSLDVIAFAKLITGSFQNVAGCAASLARSIRYFGPHGGTEDGPIDVDRNRLGLAP